MMGDKKDITNMPAPYQAVGFSLGTVTFTYTKTNKLITAMYIVTDIMDKDEPLRHKLRTLSVEILSDTHSIPTSNIKDIHKKIEEIISFLDVSHTVNMISEMNYRILKKEFLEFKDSVKEYNTKKNDPAWLEEFLKEENPPTIDTSMFSIGHSIGHQTRIGIQKGSTLMQALSDKMSFKQVSLNDSVLYKNDSFHSGFDLLKKKRQEEIVNIINIIIEKNKNNLGKNQEGATITDIKNEAQKSSKTLASCGEKTLQRELVSMVHDTVLYKTGEKRWSRYFVK